MSWLGALRRRARERYSLDDWLATVQFRTVQAIFSLDIPAEFRAGDTVVLRSTADLVEVRGFPVRHLEALYWRLYSSFAVNSTVLAIGEDGGCRVVLNPAKPGKACDAFLRAYPHGTVVIEVRRADDAKRK